MEVPDSDELLRRQGGTAPLKSELIRKGASGGFPEKIYAAFRRDRKLLERVIRRLLEGNFPESVHEDILNELGLILPVGSGLRRDRNSGGTLFAPTSIGARCAVMT